MKTKEEMEEKLYEIRHYFEYEIKLAERRIFLDEIDKTPCFDGVDVGYEKARQLNEKHILFCKQVINMIDRK